MSMTGEFAGKAELRKHYLALRKAVPREERKRGDAAICGRILALDPFAAAPGVAAYVSDGAEPDLEPVCRAVLAAGKVLALPRFVPETGEYELARVPDPARDLVPGRYGLPEPRSEMAKVTPGADWLWLVPGVAFDGAGTRLGRGGGFYDRLLAAGAGHIIGVFRQVQFHAGRLPCEAHDRKLDMAVTEIQTYSCFGPGGRPAAPELDNQRKNLKQ